MSAPLDPIGGIHRVLSCATPAWRTSVRWPSHSNLKRGSVQVRQSFAVSFGIVSSGPVVTQPLPSRRLYDADIDGSGTNHAAKLVIRNRNGLQWRWNTKRGGGRLSQFAITKCLPSKHSLGDARTLSLRRWPRSPKMAKKNVGHHRAFWPSSGQVAACGGGIVEMSVSSASIHPVLKGHHCVTGDCDSWLKPVLRSCALPGSQLSTIFTGIFSTLRFGFFPVSSAALSTYALPLAAHPPEP